MKNLTFLRQSNPMGTWDLFTGALLVLEHDANDDDDALNDKFSALASRLDFTLGFHECDCCDPRWSLPWEFEVLTKEGLDALFDKRRDFFERHFQDDLDSAQNPVLARVFGLDGSETVVHFR